MSKYTTRIEKFIRQTFNNSIIPGYMVNYSYIYIRWWVTGIVIVKISPIYRKASYRFTTRMKTSQAFLILLFSFKGFFGLISICERILICIDPLCSFGVTSVRTLSESYWKGSTNSYGVIIQLYVYMKIYICCSRCCFSCNYQRSRKLMSSYSSAL